MPDLDPKDEYPDSVDLMSVEQIQSGILPFNFIASLQKPSKPLRAWVAASPRRSLSPDAHWLAFARVEVVRPRPEWRAPRAWLPVATPEGRRPADPRAAFDVFAALLAEAGVAGKGIARSARAAKARDDRHARAVEAERLRPKPSRQEYRALVARFLAKARPALIADLRRRVFPHTFPPGMVELGFEVLSSDLDPLPFVGYMMDGRDGQVMIELPDGRRTLSGTLEILPGKAIVPRGAFKAFHGVDYPLWSIHLPMVVRWFIEGWKAAGGRECFPYLATLQYHDGSHVTKLPSAARRPRGSKSAG